MHSISILTVAAALGAVEPVLENPRAPSYSAEPQVVFIRPADFAAKVEGSGGFLFGDSGAFSRAGDLSSYRHKSAPEHIFRMNSAETGVKGTTDRNDFFLEDMFADPRSGLSFGGGSVDAEPSYDGTGGASIQVKPDGNRKVYVVDGNLWVNNSWG